MPAAIAIATAVGLIGSAAIQSRAASKSGELQAKATDVAGQREAEAQAASLAFQKQQAERDQANYLATQARNDAQFEAAQHGNYDQWAAREGRISDIGGAFGLPARQIPAYRPYAPGTIGSTMQGAAPPADRLAAAAKADGSPESIAGFFKSQGVSDQETPYWVGKWQELVDRGKELNDPQYAAKRLAAAEVFGASSLQAPTAARTMLAQPGTIRGTSSYGYSAPLTPSYVAPIMDGTIRSTYAA